MIRTEKEAIECMMKWQERLGLMDWTISLDIRSAIDMEQRQGRVTTQKTTQHAYIKILALSDRQLSDRSDHDIELDILHELVHVRLWSIDPQDPNDALHICREQAVDWLARAMLSAERSEKHKKTICKEMQ